MTIKFRFLLDLINDELTILNLLLAWKKDNLCFFNIFLIFVFWRVNWFDDSDLIVEAYSEYELAKSSQDIISYLSFLKLCSSLPYKHIFISHYLNKSIDANFKNFFLTEDVSTNVYEAFVVEFW